MTLDNVPSTIWGGIGGFFVALVAALGLYRKVEKLEEKTVTKDWCSEKEKLFMHSIEDLQDNLTHVMDRVEKIYDHLINGKKVE